MKKRRSRGVSNTKRTTLFSTGGDLKISVKKFIYEGFSDYHKIEIIDTKKFGRCLFVDDVIQLSEYDHLIYDQELLKKLTQKDQIILIIGGGDGFVARTAINSYDSIKKIVVVDIDKQIVRLSDKYFHVIDKEFKHKVEYVIDDIFSFLSYCNVSCFDYIICDLTDDPVKEDKNTLEEFYLNLLTKLKKGAKKKTWISIQAGTPTVYKGVDSFKIIKKLANTHLREVSFATKKIPSFGEDASFVFGRY
ncbi:MAG: hypothetical protein U5L10_04995 [Candidatus Moranbacteria bacterium]|nr:hypothetical protein [Candidatus Moranbacteria bacterium]